MTNDSNENKEFDPSWLLHPGDLAHNSKVMLRTVERVVADGVNTFYLPPKSLAGGDCGSLLEHPAFQKALRNEFDKFLNNVSKIERAPKIVADKNYKREYVGVGPDKRYPFCGHGGDVLECQTRGLIDRLNAINCRHVVIGLSGGLDSALTLIVAYTAFLNLKYDMSGIHVYTMPGFGTTSRTRGNADFLCQGMGLKLETIDITAACRQHFKDIGHPEDLHDVVFENTQARERTQILMDKANQVGGIVLGTGDMSEIALGWSTYNGDHMSMFATNSGVPKTAVRDTCLNWAMAIEEKFRSVEMYSPDRQKFSQLMMSANAIRDIVATPVSPELLPAKDGEIVQKTEDKIGPYELHDFFLWHFIECKEDRKQIAKATKEAFGDAYDAQTIKKWLGVFMRRLFTQAFKRNCAPDGVRVFNVYFSPDAWHVPSDISPAVIDFL